MPAKAAIKIEAAIDPVAQRIVIGERRDLRDRGGEEKAAKNTVVRIIRLLSAEPFRFIERLAQGFERQ